MMRCWRRWWMAGGIVLAVVGMAVGAAGPRKIPVVFRVHVPEELPLQVEARPAEADVEVGKRFRIEYTFRNPSNQTVRFIAGHFVAPAEYYAYFEMIECFCITGPDKRSRAITLKPGESLDAAAVIKIDKTIPDVRRLTFSYLLVPAPVEEADGQVGRWAGRQIGRWADRQMGRWAGGATPIGCGIRDTRCGITGMAGPGR
ncbi:Cytochrome c oxidase assembly protein CtaG [bacterium HR11]|nr:Cytochrome c oxidase assembly protein CtaG [bacterium HR11]